MKVVRTGDAQRDTGTTFTGEVTLDRVLPAQQPGGLAVSLVHFKDGARTYWHTHPGEQVLIVLEGEGRAGTEDQEVTIGTGDVVYAAPGERHWHGAAPGKSMIHLSITNVGSPTWEGPPD